MSQLRPCTGCSRHVWMEESRCPFCGSELTSAAEPVRSIQRSGLSRGQRLVLAAAIASQALGACAEATTGSELPDGGPIAGRSGIAGGSGGATAAGQGGVVVIGGNGGLGFMPIPPYGVSPPPPDAGKNPIPPDADAGVEDAGTE